MNFVDHLLFYMKLLNYLFCDMFGSVFGCYELTHICFIVHSRESCMNEQALLPPLVVESKAPIGAYVVVVQLLTFLNLHFIMEWLLQSYFS